MKRLLRRLATFAAPLVLLLGSVTPAHADDPGAYYDGRIAYSQVINCPSIIWGSPYTEFGAGAYTGYFADPDSGVPGVGQPVYMHVVVSGLGFPCSGGTYFWPSIDLPPNVDFYSAAPILCFYDGAPMPSQDCPQWANLGSAGPNGSVRYIRDLGNFANTWGVAQGHTIEFRFPIVGSQVVSGATLRTYLETADGNDNPTLAPTAPLYVFASGGSATPVVMYDAPSTYTSPVLPGTSTPSKFGIISEFNAVAHGQAGRAIMAIGTSSGSYPQRVSLDIPAGSTSFKMWGDWDEATIDPLQPGRTYFWRGGWDPGAPGGGDVVWGNEQTFVAPLAKTCQGQPVTVNLSLGELPTAGDDVIMGTNAGETINGQGGRDLICGGGGNDHVDGGEGNDVVDAGGGNDVVVALAGDDVLRGGAGTDTVSYAGAAAAIVADLALTSPQATGGGGLDTLTAFENLVGGNLADRLSGTSGANRLLGTGGADVLTARSGNDALVGGKGTDQCNGGPGRDTATTCEKKTSIP